MKQLAIFASGGGTNTENIIRYFNKKRQIAVVKFIITNNSNAGVINRAKGLGVPVFILTNNDFENNQGVIQLLKENRIDMIILAGFLRKINDALLNSFPGKIVNIHPSLLPKYGGKGMYGDKVHQQVIENKEKESGITIHYVNSAYDEGAIIYQSKCEVKTTDTFTDLAQKIHELEHKKFPEIIEQLLN